MRIYWPDQRAGGHTPRQRPKGALLHKPEARKRAGFTLGGSGLCITHTEAVGWLVVEWSGVNGDLFSAAMQHAPNYAPSIFEDTISLRLQIGHGCR
jgi:hypothetical protein